MQKEYQKWAKGWPKCINKSWPKKNTGKKFWRVFGDTWSIRGGIVTSGRPPTPLDAGRWKQPLSNKVLAEPGCGCQVFSMEDTKSRTKGNQNGATIKPKGKQNASTNRSRTLAWNERLPEYRFGALLDLFVSFWRHLADLVCHFGAHWILEDRSAGFFSRFYASAQNRKSTSLLTTVPLKQADRPSWSIWA